MKVKVNGEEAQFIAVQFGENDHKMEQFPIKTTDLVEHYLLMHNETVNCPLMW